MKYLSNFNHNDTTLRVGTDCSGQEGVLVALRLLKVNVIHQFSCDNDPHIKQHILSQFSPAVYYDDIRGRDLSQMPDIDLYVCGFPCQSFSLANKKREGFHCEHGLLFFEALKVIQAKQPKYFVLENVKGLMSHDKGNTYKTIHNCLRELTAYNVTYTVLNTKHFGIPHNRERLYIIGTQGTPFTLPTYEGTCPDIAEFLDGDLPATPHKCLIPRRQRVLDYAVQRHSINMAEPWVINLGASANGFAQTQHNMSPCITTVCVCYYITCYSRFLTVRECYRLQGFPDDYTITCKKVQASKQIGNSMSVNVLYYVLHGMLSHGVP